MTIISDQQTGVTPDTKRTEYIKGLRAFADLLEAHPEIPRSHHGQRAAEELVFFNGDNAVAHALTYIGAMDEAPVIKVEPKGYYRLRVVGRIHGLHIELYLKADKASELRAAFAQQGGQVSA
ncbi:hypothetical protein [Nonomuraea sp. NPDC049400]|uniref:hypothetical protein n=1 Tax=Nonomuraea sp. NPDC049400 TaxID=3364352 RepID=UPI0037A83766